MTCLRACLALTLLLAACPGSSTLPPKDGGVDAHLDLPGADGAIEDALPDVAKTDGIAIDGPPAVDGPSQTDLPPGPPCGGTCQAPSVCVGNVCHSYPPKRVGIFYLAWHAYAADAMAQLPAAQRHTVEDAIRDSALSFDDLLTPALAQQAKAFRYHVTPDLGFYCLYRKRTGEAPYAEPDFAPDCPNITNVARTHAQKLWTAGVDFIYADLTNLQGMSPFADVLGIRPLEVLLEEWVAARAAGLMTPQVAAWVPAPAKTGVMVYEKVLELYNNPAFADLILRDPISGKKVVFLVDYLSTDASRAVIEDNGGKNDIVAVRLWGLLSANKLAAGVASWMQPCQLGGQWTTIVEAGRACDQGYAANTPVGSIVSVSTSYQLSYASLPFHASGRRGGLTLKKQFERAYAVKPNYLLINSWNELIAQPQPNPHPASMGHLRHSMGVYDASGTALWVDPYGAEYVRDLEPTKEYGSAYYDLMKSCIKVYRLGGCSAGGAAGESCCALTQDFTLIRSLREKDAGNTMSTQHVLSTGDNERNTLVASGGWEEVCNPLLGLPQLCGGGTQSNADVPFELYAQPGTNRVLLMRCFTGVSNFFSLDPNCEGTQVVGPLGYLSTVRESRTARPLRRCYNATAGRHFHWLDTACPSLPGVQQEAQLGFVR